MCKFDYGAKQKIKKQQKSRHFHGQKGTYRYRCCVQLNGLDFCIFFRHGRMDGWCWASSIPHWPCLVGGPISHILAPSLLFCRLLPRSSHTRTQEHNAMCKTRNRIMSLSSHCVCVFIRPGPQQLSFLTISLSPSSLACQHVCTVRHSILILDRCHCRSLCHLEPLRVLVSLPCL